MARREGDAMELQVIASMLEDALDSNLEGAMRALRRGDNAAALEDLERAYAKVAAALQTARSAPPMKHALPGLSR